MLLVLHVPHVCLDTLILKVCAKVAPNPGLQLGVKPQRGGNCGNSGLREYWVEQAPVTVARF